MFRILESEVNPGDWDRGADRVGDERDLARLDGRRPVVAAALWLAWRIRRIWKAQRDNANRSCACLTGCDGCPFAGKTCDAGKKP